MCRFWFERFEKTMENMKKLNKIIFLTKILISTKLPNPIGESRVLKLVFITIPCLKFWAQRRLYRLYTDFLYRVLVPSSTQLETCFIADKSLSRTFKNIFSSKKTFYLLYFIEFWSTLKSRHLWVTLYLYWTH